MYVPVYYIYIDMQQKLLSVIYKIKYYRILVKICFNFECPKVCKMLMRLVYVIEAQNLAKICTK